MNTDKSKVVVFNSNGKHFLNTFKCANCTLETFNSYCSYLTASIAQLVERPLSEREVVGSNHAAAPYQRCKKWY